MLFMVILVCINSIGHNLSYSVRLSHNTKEFQSNILTLGHIIKGKL